MNRADMLQLVQDALDDDSDIAFTVDEGLPGELLVHDVDGDAWTVKVVPR